MGQCCNKIDREPNQQSNEMKTLRRRSSRRPLRGADPGLPKHICDPPLMLADEDETLEAAKKIYTTALHRWQTRILILYPGRYGEALEADLAVVDMILGEGVVLHESQANITYTALSYAWGQPVYSDRILINGHSYPITRHLYLALQRLRVDQVGKWCLWIDALCINQHDTVERSTQVTNMMAIFWKAYKVVVWLGDFDIDPDKARTEALAMDSLGGVQTSARRVSSRQTPIQGGKAKKMHSDDSLVPNTAQLCGLMRVYGRPWQTRVWVRQEVWAAHAIQVRLGDRTLSWREFRAGEKVCHDARELYSIRPDLGLDETMWSDMFSNLSILQSLRQSGSGVVASRLESSYRRFRADDAFASEVDELDPEADILDVLLRSAKSKCGDPKDRIYGIIGMSQARYRSKDQTPRGDGLEIVIDYDKSLARVYTDLAKYLVERDKHYGILYLGATYGSQEDPELPSWCPDWQTLRSISDYRTGFPWQRLVKDREPFRNHRHLRVLGVQIGTLGNTIRIFAAGSDERPSIERRLVYPYPNEAIFRMYRWSGGLLGQQIRIGPKSVMFDWKVEKSKGGHEGKKAVSVNWLHNSRGAHQAPALFVPSTAQLADIVIRTNGQELPIVLRPTPGGSAYEFVGAITSTLCIGNSQDPFDHLSNWGLRDSTNSSESADTYILR